jgi:hypothetical protein
MLGSPNTGYQDHVECKRRDEKLDASDIQVGEHAFWDLLASKARLQDTRPLKAFQQQQEKQI